MAYKGVLPSDLWERYQCEGGALMMEMDMLVAMEINDKISEATATKKDGNKAAARMQQRRSKRQTISNADAMSAFRDFGLFGPKSKGGGE